MDAMATFSFFSLASFHNRNSLFYHRRRHEQPQLLFVSHLKKKRKNDLVCFACSIKQTRVRKRVKSNEELRSEILEFVALAGLPQGHVPSMKELCAHERVDLANVVRRRGYKFIRELLANSDTQYRNELTSSSDFCSEHSFKEPQDEEALDGNLCTLASISLDQKTNNLPEEVDIANSSSEDEQEYASTSKDESSLAAVSSMEISISNLGDGNHSAEITESYSKIESVELGSIADIESSSPEASVSENHSLLLDDTSSCSDRQVSNVCMTEDKGVSDVDQDSSLTYDHYTSQHLNYTKHVGIATGSLSGFTSENTMATAENFQYQQIDDTAENRSGSADDSLLQSDDKDWTLGSSSSTSNTEEKTTRFIHNGYLDTVDVSDYENDTPNGSRPEETKESAETIKGGEYSRGGQRSLSTAPNGSAVALEEVTYATEVNSSDKNSDQRDGNAELDKDSHDETMKREYQVEITRLRFMLRQKELELSRLNEQIEKEKLSLSVLQRKAETEIQKAQILVTEKDVELQEAEESLSGLQEVEIKYCGDGNVVEVTGSFNGWEHRVGLELEASKSTGKQKCWSTLLWLYPGTYEIKFIVDGQWITDPQRDSVTRGHITNNILRVDR